MSDTEPAARPPALPASWMEAIGDQFERDHMTDLRRFLRERKAAGAEIYPPSSNVFRALQLVEPQDVRVCLIGQDPYIRPGEAHGLSFSVAPGVRKPPSLQNVYKELEDDLGIPPARHGFLEAWAKQGVLLLNNALTVERGKSGSHLNRGWEQFTDAVLKTINDGPPTVFMLWGKPAQAKAEWVDRSKHLVLATSHPSPMGGACFRGFFGSRPFSRANAFLKEHGRGEIDWRLPDVAA